MAQRRPLVLNSATGDPQQIPASDAISIACGGTGATTIAGAQAALGITNAALGEYYGNVAVTSGTTQIPFGNSAPLITGGTQVWTETLTPNNNTTSFQIEFAGTIDSSASNNVVTVALFRGSTLVGFTCVNISTTNKPIPLTLKVNDSPATNAAVTYTCRIGGSVSGTWYLGRSASNSMGGVNPSGWTIKEVV